MGNKFCGNCGTAFDPVTGICPNCGERREPDYGDSPTLQADGPRYDAQYDSYSDPSYGGYGSGGYSDSYGDYGSGSGSYGSGGSYGPGGYTGSGQAAAPAGNDGKNKMMTLLIVLGAVLVLLVAVVVLEVTGVTGIFRKKDKSDTGSGSRTVAAEENKKDDGGTKMSLTGTITSESYNGGTIYVLNLESEREFRPEGKDAETFGSKFSTSKVQIVSNLAAGYVNHSARVDGIQRYRSETGHKYDVILTDVTIEDYGDAGGAANATQTAAPVQQPVQQPATPAVNTQPSGTVISATMTASTYQPHNGSRYYTPTQANDNDPETCWMAYNPSAHGANVSITMNFGGTYRVSGIRFMNGNCWNDVDDVFHLNGRVCGYTVSYDGGTITSGTAADVRREYTYVTFPTPVNASFITFHVDSTYWGSKYPTVVCLAEIQAVA